MTDTPDIDTSDIDLRSASPSTLLPSNAMETTLDVVVDGSRAGGSHDGAPADDGASSSERTLAQPSPRRRRRVSVWGALLVVAGAISAVWIYHAGRSLNYYFDEWGFVISRRGSSLDAYLQPNNGHLVAVPVVMFKVVWAFFGLRTYVPLRVVTIVWHLAIVALMWRLVRDRGPRSLMAAFVLVLMFMGRAWQDLLWPFQAAFFGALAFGLGALVLLQQRTRRRNLGASICIGLALASSGMGIPITAGISTELVLEDGSWRDRIRRLWVVAAPMALYLLWYRSYGQSDARRDNVDAIPSYTAAAASGVMRAITGVSESNGRLMLGLAIGLGVSVLTVRRFVTPRLAMAVVTVTMFWVMSTLTRAQFNEPAASRYLYPGAVFVLLALAELVSMTRVRTLGVIGFAVVAMCTAYSIVHNNREMRAGAGGLRETSTLLEPGLAITELLRDRANPTAAIDPLRAPQLNVASYLSAVADLGSPVDHRDIEQMSPAKQIAADVAVLQVLGVSVASVQPPAVPSGTAPAVETVSTSTVDTTTSGCLVFTPSAQGGHLEVSSSSGALLISATDGRRANIFVRSLSSAYGPLPTATVLGPAGELMTLPDPVRGELWHVRIDADGPTTVCRTQ